MNDERLKEIEAEAKRRLDLWLKNSSFERMSAGGSRLRFDMSLGLIGFPFIKEDWMIDFNVFVTDNEFNSEQYYDKIINKLFNDAFKEQNTKIKIGIKS